METEIINELLLSGKENIIDRFKTLLQSMKNTMSIQPTKTFDAYVKNVILATIIFAIGACRNNNKRDTIRQRQESYSSLSSVVTRDAKSDNASPFKEKPFFNINEPIRILSIYKVYDPTSSTYDSSAATMRQYDGWKLNKTDILYILKNSKSISGTELDLSYLVLPFWYKGSLIINGKQGTYKVNAASFTTIQINDTTIYLGYSKDSNNRYFIVPPDFE